MSRLLASVGILKRTRVVDGVRYRERSGESLRRVMTPGSNGVKEYDVRFPLADTARRRSMKIRCTPQRVYHDLWADPRVGIYERVIDRVVPGMRVLELGCGTGAGSALIAHAVGPSGGVISIDRDGESVRFARQRYLSDHAGFELGWTESLSAETDNAFDAVFAVRPLAAIRGAHERRKECAELARVLRELGTLVLVCDPDAERADTLEHLEALGLTRAERTQQFHAARSGWSWIELTKPQTRRTNERRDDDD